MHTCFASFDNQEVVIHQWRQQEKAAKYFILDVVWQSQRSIYVTGFRETILNHTLEVTR